MTTATLAPPATDIELFVAARRQHLNQIEANATRLMPERAREPLKGKRDRAAAEFDRALARNMAERPDQLGETIATEMQSWQREKLVSIGSDGHGNDFLVDESLIGTPWTPFPGCATT